MVAPYSFCKILFYFQKSKQAESLFQQNKILDINCGWREEYEILQNITRRKQSTNIKQVCAFFKPFFFFRFVDFKIWFNGQEGVILKYWLLQKNKFFFYKFKLPLTHKNLSLHIVNLNILFYFYFILSPAITMGLRRTGSVCFIQFEFKWFIQKSLHLETCLLYIFTINVSTDNKYINGKIGF